MPDSEQKLKPIALLFDRIRGSPKMPDFEHKPMPVALLFDRKQSSPRMPDSKQRPKPIALLYERKQVPEKMFPAGVIRFNVFLLIVLAKRYDLPKLTHFFKFEIF